MISKIKKLFKLFFNSSYRFLFLASHGFFNSLSDRKFLERAFELKMGYKLDLNNPQTFNEKLQWLKLYDRNPKYTEMVDKYEVKNYVSKIIGNEYIIPTFGVFDKFEDIDFAKLPEKFVLKCTHDSGGVVICNDKSILNIKKAREKINSSLKRNFYYSGREWPYKDVKPRIIVEKFMQDDSCKEIRDYKFFCFNGIPKIMYISEGSHSEKQKIIFYDDKFEEMKISRSDYQPFDKKPEKPINFEKMIELSRVLSAGIPHVRVDWYEINGKVYFGELTFYTGSGLIPFTDKKWDYLLGDYINLQKNQ